MGIHTPQIAQFCSQGCWARGGEEFFRLFIFVLSASTAVIPWASVARLGVTYDYAVAPGATTASADNIPSRFTSLHTCGELWALCPSCWCWRLLFCVCRAQWRADAATGGGSCSHEPASEQVF